MNPTMRLAAMFLGALALAAALAALGSFGAAAAFGLLSMAALVAHGVALWRGR